jgi:hypothetical protein
MSENSLIIENIDKPLYKYGMIYKQDINNYFSENGKLKPKQKLKCFSITVFIVSGVLKTAISMKLLKNGRIPDYCFDIVQHIGGIVIYVLIAVFLLALMTAGFNYRFNTGIESHMKWLQIIKVLKGVSSVEELRIPEKNKVIKLFLNTDKLYKVLKLSFNCLMTIIFLMLTAIIVFKYDLFRAISIGLISLIVLWLHSYYIASIFYYSLMYFLIISYYCKLRMNSINENLKILIEKFIVPNKSIDNLLKDHNDICNTINDYNIFWKRIYELTLYGIIPINLIFLHQIFFEDLLLINRLAFIIAVIPNLSLLFVLNFMTASVHKEVSKSYRLINSLLLKLGSNLATRRRKIKVIFQIYILEKKNYLLKFVLYRYFQLWKE